MRHGIFNALIVAAGCLALDGRLPAPAGTIQYDPARRCVEVAGFPADAPASADDLRAWEKQNALGIIGYDAETDACTVRASLWIGGEHAPETFFRIGRRPDHPRETLVVQGEVWVRPAPEIRLEGGSALRRSDGRMPRVNRLTLGDAANSNLQATLKIECATNSQYGLRIGDANSGRLSGELHVYHGVITAADPARRLAPSMLFGADIRLVNARVSCMQKFLAYGLQSGNSLVTGTVFEVGGSALINGVQFARNCVFRDLETAVLDYGSLDATLVDCVFENNRCDWTLGGNAGKKIVMIDCTLPPDSRFHIRKNTAGPEQIRRAQCPVYPVCEQWRTLVVSVRDAITARPLADAVVDVICDAHPAAVQNAPALTNPAGRTPEDYAQYPIRLLYRRFTATDLPDRTAITDDYVYRIRATAPGYAVAEITALKPGGSCNIILKRTAAAAASEKNQK